MSNFVDNIPTEYVKNLFLGKIIKTSNKTKIKSREYHYSVTGFHVTGTNSILSSKKMRGKIIKFKIIKNLNLASKNKDKDAPDL